MELSGPYIFLHLTTLCDNNGHLGTVLGAGGDVFDLAKGEEAVEEFAKDDVFAVEEVGLGAGDEELPVSGRGGGAQ